MSEELLKTLERMDSVVSSVAGEDGALVYFLYQTDRIGHLSQEIWQVKTLTPDVKKRVFIIPHFSDTPTVNVAVCKTMLENDAVLKVPYNIARQFAAINAGMVHTSTHAYLMADVTEISRLMAKHILSGGKTARLEQTPDMKHKADGLKEKLGLGVDRPIVTVHVREPGYVPDLQHHRYRDADPLTYLPAIKWLLDQEYSILRIGDPSMQPLPLEDPRVVDAPFCENRTQDIEALLIPDSAFYLGMLTGPFTIARAYEVPLLMTNCTTTFNLPLGPKDIQVFKRFYCHKRRRFLTYEQTAIEMGPKFSFAKDFTDAGYTWQNNSQEILLDATKEMVSNLKGEYEVEPEFIRYQKLINKKAHLAAIRNNDFFAPHYGESRLSREFVRRYPDYLPYKS